MEKLRLVKLSEQFDKGIYDMLQRIESNENEFKNTAYRLSPSEFQSWLITQDAWSRGEQLPDGYVPQTIFWLYDEDTVVGIGKIRHRLNEKSRYIGGNIGNAIDPIYRGRGYATILLKYLVEKARNMGINEILLTVEKYNPSSKRVIEKAGGQLFKESNDRWYFKF